MTKNHVIVAFVLICAVLRGAELRVPAFTAYGEPDPQALKVSEKRGVTNWSDAANKIVWHGNIKTPGKLEISLALRMPETKSAEYKVRVAEKTLSAKASVGDDKEKVINVAFGSVEIEKPGYYSFALEGVSKDGKTFGDVEALVFSGPATEGAHFNLKPRRNAASVHLMYPIPKDAKVEWFYNEVTVRTEPLWSYYMACGFHRGYFGIQVNSPTERRIIFSVWDSGNEGVDRKKSCGRRSRAIARQRRERRCERFRK